MIRGMLIGMSVAIGLGLVLLAPGAARAQLGDMQMRSGGGSGRPGISKVLPGPFITSPYEPFLPRYHTWSIGTALRYWPYDRHDGKKTDASATYLLETSVSYVTSNQFAVAVAVPTVLTADAPTGTPRRATGIGDVGVSGRWWFCQGCQNKLDAAFEFGFTIPSGATRMPVDAGTGFGHSILRAAFKLSAGDQTTEGTRFHLVLGHLWHTQRKNGTDSTEVVLGVIRGTSLGKKDKGGETDTQSSQVALGLDLAATFTERPGDNSMWDLAPTVTWMKPIGKRPGSDVTRSIYAAFEVHWRLDNDGLYSSWSPQISLGADF